MGSIFFLREAIKQGAHYIECDVQVTKDLQLICNHNPWLSKVTEDVSKNSEFTIRRKTKIVLYEDPYEDKYIEMNVTDWFVHDFMEEEIKNLRRIQPLKHRDPQYNYKEVFCSFQEYINIAREHNVGIYPEIKYPYFINSILCSRGLNTTVEQLLVEALNKNGYTEVNSKCFIQSFEKKSLEMLNGRTNLKRIYLLWEDVQQLSNLDSKHKGKKNMEMWNVALNWAKKENISGFGLDKNFIIAKTPNNYISQIYHYMLQEAKEYGMMVHVYTFAHDEETFLWNYGKDPDKEYQSFSDIGVDGFFTDFPAIARRSLEAQDLCINNVGTKPSPADFLMFSTGLLLLDLTGHI